MKTTTKYLVDDCIKNSSNVWDLPNNTYKFHILEVRDTRKSGQALAKTTIGLCMLGNILKKLTATNIASVKDADGKFQLDTTQEFGIEIKDGNIERAALIAAKVEQKVEVAEF